jgi:hypothetical protein
MTVTLTIPQQVHEITEVRVHVEYDEEPDVSWLLPDADNYRGCTPEEIATYLAQDEARLAAFDRGEWHMIGVWVSLHDATGTAVLRSPGLWGIESDADNGYLAEVVNDQLSEISGQVDGDLNALPQSRHDDY